MEIQLDMKIHTFSLFGCRCEGSPIYEVAKINSFAVGNLFKTNCVSSVSSDGSSAHFPADSESPPETLSAAAGQILPTTGAGGHDDSISLNSIILRLLSRTRQRAIQANHSGAAGCQCWEEH